MAEWIGGKSMKSQIKLGTVFGVELGLHYSWLVIALLIIFSPVAQFHAVNRDWSDALVWSTAIITGLLFFACLFAHELSHAVVAKARGIPVHKITLFLLGGVAQIEEEASDPKTEFWMAIVGPITSGLLGLAMFGLARLSGWTLWASPTTPGTALLVWLGYINLALGAFNMIPGFPLDGGRVLHAILWWAMEDAEPQRGQRHSWGRSSPFYLLPLEFSGSFREQAWGDSGLPLLVPFASSWRHAHTGPNGHTSPRPAR